MYFFVNDYNSIGYPQILDALKDALDEKFLDTGQIPIAKMPENS